MMNIGKQMTRADISRSTAVWRKIREQTEDRVMYTVDDNGFPTFQIAEVIIIEGTTR